MTAERREKFERMGVYQTDLYELSRNVPTGSDNVKSVHLASLPLKIHILSFSPLTLDPNPE